TLPSRDGNRDLWIEFDDEKGVEILKLVLTPTPIKLFDEALNRSQGELGESVFSVSQELLGGNQRPEPGSNQRFEQVVRVRPQKTPVSGCPGARGLALRCRSLGLDPPDPKSGKGTVVVAMPDSQNASGKLNKNEAIIVELRLKHI
ncbi:MAG TPA: hypothetical protein VJ302_27190, partial [Blastocatellia bacterium]|nr:hypothetical protein [Blastocatellia bacterium]